MLRRIVHIDMDAFFAAVECVHNPALRGKPLVVGGEKDSVRGVVSTASYEARRFGVHSAMPIAQARRLCPQGIFVRGQFHLYREASQTIRRVLGRVSPLVQMASIDEAYIDVTGSQKLFGGDDAIADFIKSEIFAQTQLPCTVAITPNKLVSKIASDEGKPDGYVRVDAGDEAAFLAPLAVRKLPGAGPRTCETLESLGIRTLGQLAALPLPTLEGVFGTVTALGLQRAAQGVSTTPVETASQPKSISRETTFPQDVLDWARLDSVLTCLTERCTSTLREQGLECKRVTLKVRYGDFETKTFAKTLSESTCVDRDILAALQELLPKGKARRARVRLIGVALGALRYNQHQLRLFGGESHQKWEQTLAHVDKMREKFGFDAVHFGKALGAETPPPPTLARPEDGPAR
jgi:DNA polymerase IV